MLIPPSLRSPSPTAHRRAPRSPLRLHVPITSYAVKQRGGGYLPGENDNYGGTDKAADVKPVPQCCVPGRREMIQAVRREPGVMVPPLRPCLAPRFRFARRS